MNPPRRRRPNQGRSQPPADRPLHLLPARLVSLDPDQEAEALAALAALLRPFLAASREAAAPADPAA